MRLRDLEAEFLEYQHTHSFRRIELFSDADGIVFLCPKCYADRASNVGVHSVICWFRGHVPDEAFPAPGRWTPAGTGLDDLTFVPGDPPMATSVLLTGGCRWHGFVTNGDAT